MADSNDAAPGEKASAVIDTPATDTPAIDDEDLPDSDDGDGLAELGLEDTPDDATASFEDVPFDPNAQDPDVEEVVGNVTEILSTSPGSSRSEVEWHTSQGYKYRGQVDFTELQEAQEKIAQFERIVISVMKTVEDGTKTAVKNLQGTLMIRTAGIHTGEQAGGPEVITWWNSGKHLEKDGKWVAKRGGRSATKFPTFRFSKKDRPYVRFNVGKVGKKKIVFSVFPLEKG